MQMEMMTLDEMSNHYSGEAITLTAVLAILAAAVVAVVVYKLFVSNKGSATIGGWKFSWA